MRLIHVLPILLLLFSARSWADDASDVRAAIERHYQAINAQEETRALADHLPCH